MGIVERIATIVSSRIREESAKLKAAERRIQALNEEVDFWHRAWQEAVGKVSQPEQEHASETKIFDLAEYDIDGACSQVRADVWNGPSSAIELVRVDTGETMLRIVGQIIEPAYEMFEPLASVFGKAGSGLRCEHGATEKVREYLQLHKGVLVYERARCSRKERKAA